ncbi:MAG: SHOCT domain-containing protein [Chloroflexi bacterium]|nr:SHOCT domain-containing protein [Chloroflexota bacterium]
MMFGGGMLLGWLLPVILLVLGGMWLFNNATPSRRSGSDDFSPRTRDKSAAEILDERYARGEITQSEYKEMAEALRR